MNSKELKIEQMNLSRLAELVGILLGDGSLSLKAANSSQINRMKISFNSKDDIQYVSHVVALIRNLLGEKPIFKQRFGENTADLFIFKKKIISFLIDDVGLRLSPKGDNAIIPEQFLRDNLDLNVLKGYFDTDGCLVTTNNNGTIYPRLEFKICPSPMQAQFIDILKKYHFRFGVYDIGKKKIRIQLNGKSQLKKWQKLVGFNNPKHFYKLNRFV